MNCVIPSPLQIACSVLVGCNLQHEIANNNFCEGTIGCRDQKYMRILQDLFKSDTFRVTVTDDADCVEICAILRVSCVNRSGSGSINRFL